MTSTTDKSTSLNQALRPPSQRTLKRQRQRRQERHDTLQQLIRESLTAHPYVTLEAGAAFAKRLVEISNRKNGQRGVSWRRLNSPAYPRYAFDPRLGFDPNDFAYGLELLSSLTTRTRLIIADPLPEERVYDDGTGTMVDPDLRVVIPVKTGTGRLWPEFIAGAATALFPDNVGAMAYFTAQIAKSYPLRWMGPYDRDIITRIIPHAFAGNFVLAANYLLAAQEEIVRIGGEVSHNAPNLLLLHAALEVITSRRDRDAYFAALEEFAPSIWGWSRAWLAQQEREMTTRSWGRIPRATIEIPSFGQDN
jgi:hypothetical protein